ncbi:TROVE domain-containing protein [Halococcoides cellulosivorans]|uniref:TROVE domain-containing protein n=1 Tax=Halococcoides cellulosivorans TaxID=1679096 RepID=A0A2R4X3Z2_9EURY|nr:TROVE domain-containing protein [Halococcoides cellulosivorans]AWB28507.1 TROVE domain-containing protein [Halococcoides cellulosivorans]
MQFNDTTQTVAEATRTTNNEGGEAFDPADPRLALYKRTINQLLEDSYYEDDEEHLAAIVQRFDAAADEDPEFVLKLAAYARQELYLRDVPQVLLVLAANDDRFKDDTDESLIREWAPQIIQRMDETATALAIHDDLFGGTAPWPLRRGIEDALVDMADAYTLEKYELSRREVTLRDVFNRVHPTPVDDDQEVLFERFMRGDLDDYPDVEPLPTPKTWETVISERGNTRDAWETLIEDDAYSLPIFASIRNLRNMLEAGVEEATIVEYLDLEAVRHAPLYPFRYYQAYKALQDAGIDAPAVERWLEWAVDVSVESVPEGLGDTFVGVDLSGSMDTVLSEQSAIRYKEIGALFGAVLADQGARVGGFGDDFQDVSTHVDTPVLQRQDALLGIDREVGNSTNGWKVLEYLREEAIAVDRVVLFTDMQIWDSRWRVPDDARTVREAFEAYRDTIAPDVSLYMIDLASYGDLVTPEGYEGVYNVSGWSENVLEFIEHAEDPLQVIDEIEAFEPV